MALEKLGIDHVGAKLRHGRPFITFTLWFAANLTIADYALGSLLRAPAWLLDSCDSNRKYTRWTASWAEKVAANGPKFGIRQMMISRAYFGKKGKFAICNSELDQHSWVVHGKYNSRQLCLATCPSHPILPKRACAHSDTGDNSDVWP